jgi:DNA-binding MarR family transcriptional regulator
MTDTPTLTGQDIGQAERATRAVLDRLLADDPALGQAADPFLQWVALNLLATGGPTTEERLVGRLTAGLKLGEPPIVAALAQLVAAGLVSTEPAATGGEVTAPVELTAEGAEVFGRVSRGIGRITDRLYGGLPPTDLATAHRVLATVTERANAELAT